MDNIIRNFFKNNLFLLIFSVSFLFIFFWQASNAFAATYYVSNTGLDTNNGTTEGTPWQTISKVNSFTFASGDSILFKKGDTFYGSLIIPRSGLTISSYGSGEKPIISGFQTITGWTETSPGSGIYSAPTNATSSLSMVTVNGVNTPMGRWPKTGWSTFESFSGRTSITDNQLTNTPNWTGAEVVIKKNNWTIDRSVITNHTNNTITYTSGSTSNPVSVDGVYSYFIQKSLNTLTQMGDWYTDGVNLYMYFGVFGNSNNVITVYNCNINNNNGFGVYITSTSATLSNSIIDSNGVFAGMGKADGVSYSGVYMRSTGGLVEYNQVTNAGYNGIMFYNDNFIVRYNKVEGTNSLITDGAGIYTFNGNPATPNTGQKVYNNIVIDGGANGLYNDNSANHIEWYNNVISNVAKYGIHMNDGYSNSIHNNIFNNATLGGISIQNLYLLEGYNHDNTIYSNTVSQGVNTSHMTLLGDSRTYTVNNFGTSDNNAFIAESSGLNLHHELHVLPSYGLTNYTFANWKTFTGKETNSTLTTATLSSILFDYNATGSNKTVSLAVPMIDGLGTKYTGSTILLPYTGIVLIPDPNPTIADSTAPLISSFTIPTTSTSLAISITTLSATDSTGVTGYLLSESSTTPSASSGSWSSTPQTSYTFTTQGTKTLYAFAKDAAGNVSSYASDTITITLSPTTYTLTYTANANGTITGTTSQTVNSGSSGSAVTAVPSTGYHFTSWSDASTSNPRTDTNVIANKSVSASFAINTYTITATTGSNGTVTPTGTTTKNYGTSQSYTITPATGYHILNVLVDGVSQGTTNTYIFTNIVAGHSISATFAIDVINTYTLTINKTGTGSGTVTGATTYNSGTIVTAIATPSTGSTFTSFGGDCNASGVVTMTTNKTCIATFTLIPVVTAGGGGGGGGASSTTTITCPTGTTLVNTTCVTNTTTSATLIDKAKQKDIKPDGSINIIDFNIIMANWNKTYTKDISLTKGDITGDGLINIFDMNQLMVMWGVRY